MSAPNGYVLGVDLGTSHTVAVIRWPDGRSRPLLVDGAPVMPSAVYLDEAGHLHVGRDAERLAQTDPARFEPNPKHRIGEATVLLGDREIPTTALLAAILRNVAAKSVETVGHLPPAVLTYPAKWAAGRRSILEDAAANAGFPPVKLIPEPVAAAHYFAQVMRQPIPVGAAVAVFDFGGGTLDIAVVRHQPDGTFTVLSDGGLDDLGGLDIDAALVEYLGTTISAHVPQTWQQLTFPQTGTDRRHRRLFWDDVRGAKEMLSRTTVAPVPVPGVESALHLTREELERLATPLLARAVEETRRVIANAGISPDRLAGLFLVGGASRIPLVGRMLHSGLSIAPTVLEQPELPVAEGSLAAGFPAPPIPVSPAPAATPAQTPPPPGPGGPPQGFLPPGPPPTPWYKKKTTWIAAGAAAIVLALLGWWVFYDAYPQRDMIALEQVGTDVAYPGDPEATPAKVYAPDIDGTTAYHLTGDSETEVVITSINLETGELNWESPPLTGIDVSGIVAQNGFLYIEDKTDYETNQLTFVNNENGDTYKSISLGNSVRLQLQHGRLFTIDSANVTAYDRTGEQLWTTPFDTPIVEGEIVRDWQWYADPINTSTPTGDGKLWVRDDTGTVNILNAADGSITATKQLASTEANFFAYEDKMLVADGDAGYAVTAYDIEDKLTKLNSWKPEGAQQKPTDMTVCGETRFCVYEDRDDDLNTDGIAVMDFDGSIAWTSPKGQLVTGVTPAGESLAVTRQVSAEDASQVTQIYDADFEALGKEQPSWANRIDSGSYLKFPASWNSPSVTSDDFAFRGFGARDGRSYELGSRTILPQCDATDKYLTCPVDKTGFQVWKFRD